MPNREPMPAALAREFPVLIVGARIDEDSAVGRSVGEIEAELATLGRPVTLAHSLDDAEAAVESNPALSCVVIGWGLASASDEALVQTRRILARIRRHAQAIPILLGAARTTTRQIPLEVIEQV